jgi:hypothetical protein
LGRGEERVRLRDDDGGIEGGRKEKRTDRGEERYMVVGRRKVNTGGESGDACIIH